MIDCLPLNGQIVGAARSVQSERVEGEEERLPGPQAGNGSHRRLIGVLLDGDGEGVVGGIAAAVSHDQTKEEGAHSQPRHVSDQLLMAGIL